MDTILGIPVVPLAIFMICLVLILLLGLMSIAVRHWIFWQMSLRNVSRRLSQTVLITLGLMLSTVLITSSFTLGDSVSYSFKTTSLAQVGDLDEGLLQQMQVARSEVSYFSPQDVQQIPTKLQGQADIAAISGAVMTPQQSNAIFDDTSKQISAENFALAVPPDFQKVWGEALQSNNGNRLNFSDLRGNDVFMGQTLAQILNAHVGDSLRIFLKLDQPTVFKISAIMNTDINPTGGSSPMLVLPLSTYRQAVGEPGALNVFFVKNQGKGGIDNLRVTRPVYNYLQTQFPLLQIRPFKQIAVNSSTDTGAVITLAMLTISILLIIAGMLLIYLIFYTLAAERKAELGMSRAIGMKRRYLIEMFVFEGMFYTLASSLIGLPIGIGVTAILVQFVNNTPFPGGILLGGLHLQDQVSWPILLISFSLGVLLTFCVVFFSSYRVSRTNIVAAIRDLEDTTVKEQSLASCARDISIAYQRGFQLLVQGHVPGFLLYVTWKPCVGLCRLLWAVCVRGPVVILLGVLLLMSGIQARDLFPYTLGVSLLMSGICLTLRWILVLSGKSQEFASRLTFTLLGSGLLVYLLQPFGPFERLIGIYSSLGMETYKSNTTVFFVSAIFSITAAIWLVIYNNSFLIKGITTITRSTGRATSVVRIGLSYPLAQKFRTGMTVAMFSLVILVIMMVIVLVMGLIQYTNINRLSGGWTLQTDSAGLPSNFLSQVQANPTIGKELGAIVWEHTQRSVEHINAPGGVAIVGQVNLRAASDSFLTISQQDFTGSDTGPQFQARAAGYTSDQQIWAAVQNHSGLAVLCDGSGSLTTINTGFQPMDTTLQQLNDDQTLGPVAHVKIIGVLSMFYAWPGMVVSTRTASHILADQPINPTVYFMRPRPNGSSNQLRLDMGALFGYKYGVQIETLQTSDTVQLANNLAIFLTSYLALGLIIGICALGVISSRAVVERRQQIGMLRALGFARRPIQWAFLLESSFIAILGIAIGSILGIWSAYKLSNILFLKTDLSQLPVGAILLILLGTYLATLLTTYVPAHTAAKVLPAEALRYE